MKGGVGRGLTNRSIAGRASRALLLASLAVALAMLATPTATRACGFHDPKVLAQGMLNWQYPQSLYVTGAIWSAQQAGELPMPDRERILARGETRKRLEEEAFQKAVAALHALGMAIETADGRPDGPHVSLVLIEPLLWTRFVHAGEQVGVVTHAKHAREGDLVVVTDEPVLHAIDEGRLSVADARAKGFIRLYGTPEQESAFIEAFGSIGNHRLPEVKARDIWRRSRLGQQAEAIVTDATGESDTR